MVTHNRPSLRRSGAWAGVIVTVVVCAAILVPSKQIRRKGGYYTSAASIHLCQIGELVKRANEVGVHPGQFGSLEGFIDFAEERFQVSQDPWRPDNWMLDPRGRPYRWDFIQKGPGWELVVTASGVDGVFSPVGEIGDDTFLSASCDYNQDISIKVVDWIALVPNEYWEVK